MLREGVAREYTVRAVSEKQTRFQTFETKSNVIYLCISNEISKSFIYPVNAFILFFCLFYPSVELGNSRR